MIKKLILSLCLLTAAATGARAQYASDGYIDSRDEDWLHRGYSGSVCIGGGFDDYGHVFDLMTSHGFQFNNWLYVGAGIGYRNMDNSWDDNNVFLLFANPHFNLPLQSRFSPFLDIHAGLANGFYFSPSLGCRFALNELWGINLSAGYVYQSGSNKNGTTSAIVFRFGIDLNL